MAKVLSVNINKEVKGSKQKISQGQFIQNHGLADDVHAGDWHRQVSFLANESIQKMKDLGIQNLEYGIFAENITTSGIDVHSLEIGSRLKIADAIFEITQIGKECHTPCGIYHRVGTCVMPTEGVFARVLQSGLVSEGDEIALL